ncbi:MAG: diguanylate cyclase [Clostridiales bacterium]|nr:diguanylate cyclase [Clostridiales bacterium]
MTNSSDNKSRLPKNTILIVDDSELNRSLLSDMLSEEFEIIEAENGMEAVVILQEHELEIALVLLDIVMPEMDGFDVLAMMNKKGWIDSIPVIMISAETGSTYIDRAYDLGAVDYISRPFDERTVQHRVMSNYMLALKQKEMTDMLTTQIYNHERDNRLMIEILSHIVEFRNGESGLHILHVSTFTEMILKHLLEITDKYPLTPTEIRTICTASALHDIGKMSVPEEILNKPGRLTQEEFAIMKQHAAAGAKMLNDIPYRHNDILIKFGSEICRWHHERYDGRGYPDGIKGDEIPIWAQVVALADVYDALTSKRVYKDGFTHEKAVDMIMHGECGAFNPLILQCLQDLQEQLKKALGVTSPTSSSEYDMRKNVEMMLKSGETAVSDRTIRLLEHERMKNNFYERLSREVLFEYVASPEMIILSEWGAEYLNLPEKIINPRESGFGNKVFSQEDFDKLIAKMQSTSPERPVVEEKYLLNINGESKWNKVIVQTLWNSDEEQPHFDGALGKLVDVNDEIEEMQQLETRADHDASTGLLNHQAAKRRISKQLADAGEKKYALLFFDLDNLKKANDNHGHLFGDKLIKTVADRMLQNTRSTDICARMGGDEFIIFMEYKHDPEMLVDRIFHCLTEPMDDFDVRVSMGVALADDFAGDYDDLFHMADQAAYAVKYGSKNSYKFYDKQLSTTGKSLVEVQEQEEKGRR